MKEWSENWEGWIWGYTYICKDELGVQYELGLSEEVLTLQLGALQQFSKRQRCEVVEGQQDTHQVCTHRYQVRMLQVIQFYIR